MTTKLTIESIKAVAKTAKPTAKKDITGASVKAVAYEILIDGQTQDGLYLRCFGNQADICEGKATEAKATDKVIESIGSVAAAVVFLNKALKPETK